MLFRCSFNFSQLSFRIVVSLPMTLTGYWLASSTVTLKTFIYDIQVENVCELNMILLPLRVDFPL